eukprot:SAG22_NODE_53_length_24242_cov_158.884231_21_plen_110_part_00
MVFSGPRSSGGVGGAGRVNMTVEVAPAGAGAGRLWSLYTTSLPLSRPAAAHPCFGYTPGCAGYSCLASDEAAAAAGREGVLVLWETGVDSGCSGAACRIMLSRVPLPRE